jgi:hypothetical protein
MIQHHFSKVVWQERERESMMVPLYRLWMLVMANRALLYYLDSVLVQRVRVCRAVVVVR